MRYLLRNDISYLLHRRKYFLVLLFLVPFLSFTYYIGSQDEIFLYEIMFGTNLRNNANIMEFLMYLFQLFTYLFLMLDLYVKDIKFQLENIFLRMNPTLWILQRICILFIFIFILKLIGYWIPGVIVLLFQHSIQLDKIISIFLIDTIYTSAVIVFILFLILCSTYSKTRLIIDIIYCSIFICLLPKNIFKCWEIMGYLGLFIFLVSIFNILYVKKNYMKLIQKVGGI